jgi:fibronectin type 3 domain-containing protein
MTTLSFSVNGGATAGALFEVRAVQGRTERANLMLASYCTGGTIPANAWTTCRVPLSALVPAGGAIDGIILQAIDGRALPTMYFDAVGLAGSTAPAAPAAPTDLTAAAVASSVSLAWGAVSGATGYDVLRSTAAGGPFSKLTGSPQAATTYTDTAVAAGATYWYQVQAVNDAGSSASSATASATVPAAQDTSVPVFSDALASGWSDWSWGGTRDWANASPVAAGSRSVAVTFTDPFAGIYFRHTAGPISGMTAFELSVDGGAAAGNKLQVVAVQGETESAPVALEGYCAGGTIPANAWTRCKVPLSALLPQGGSVDGIYLREVDGAARPTMYLDEVALTGAGSTAPAVPAAPSSLAAAASTGAISLSWGAVSGASGYDVYRATAAAGSFAKLTTAPQTATTYQDTACTAGATYWYQVRAVNAAGSSSASNTASATVPSAPSPVAVQVSPATTTLDACKAVKLTATVTGASSGAVTWAVQEGAAGGSVDSAGNYTAPDTAGTYHVVATSSASPTASAVASVTVQQHVLSVQVSPATVALASSGRTQLAATITTTCGTFTAQ